MSNCDPAILTTHTPHTMRPDLSCICPACRIRRARYGSNQITTPLPSQDSGPPRLNLDFTRPDHPTHFPLLNLERFESMADNANVGSGYVFFPPFGSYDLAPRTQVDAYYAAEAENDDVVQNEEMDNLSVTAVKDADLSELADVVPNPTLSPSVASTTDMRPFLLSSTDATASLSRTAMESIPKRNGNAHPPGQRITRVAPAPAAKNLDVAPHALAMKSTDMAYPSTIITGDASSYLSRTMMDPSTTNIGTASTPGQRATGAVPAPAAARTTDSVPHLIPSATGLTHRMNMQGWWDHERPVAGATDNVPDPVDSLADAMPSPRQRAKNAVSAPAVRTKDTVPRTVPSMTRTGARSPLFMSMHGYWDTPSGLGATDVVPDSVRDRTDAAPPPAPKVVDTTTPPAMATDLMCPPATSGFSRVKSKGGADTKRGAPPAGSIPVPPLKYTDAVPNRDMMAADLASLAQVTMATNVVSPHAEGAAWRRASKANPVKGSGTPAAGSKSAPPFRPMDPLPTPITRPSDALSVVQAKMAKVNMSPPTSKALDPAPPQSLTTATSIVPPKPRKRRIPKKANEDSEKESADLERKCEKIKKEIETMDKLIERLGQVSLGEREKTRAGMRLENDEQATKRMENLDGDDTEDTISEGWEKVVDPDKDEWEMVEELKF